MQIFDEFWEKFGFSSKIMRNDRISSGFSVKILSNDVIHHIHVLMVIKNRSLICINYANMHICKYFFCISLFYCYIFYCFNWFLFLFFF